MDVRAEALGEMKAGIQELVELVEENEPRRLQRLLQRRRCQDDCRARPSDAASLEYHLEVAGPVFRRFVELVTLSSIQIYGQAGEKLVEQAQEKADLLGRA